MYRETNRIIGKIRPQILVFVVAMVIIELLVRLVTSVPGAIVLGLLQIVPFIWLGYEAHVVQLDPGRNHIEKNSSGFFGFFLISIVVGLLTFGLAKLLIVLLLASMDPDKLFRFALFNLAFTNILAYLFVFVGVFPFIGTVLPATVMGQRTGFINAFVRGKRHFGLIAARMVEGPFALNCAMLFLSILIFESPTIMGQLFHGHVGFILSSSITIFVLFIYCYVTVMASWITSSVFIEAKKHESDTNLAIGSISP